jgi:hypothetical protein
VHLFSSQDQIVAGAENLFFVEFSTDDQAEFFIGGAENLGSPLIISSEAGESPSSLVPVQKVTLLQPTDGGGGDEPPAPAMFNTCCFFGTATQLNQNQCMSSGGTFIGDVDPATNPCQGIP